MSVLLINGPNLNMLGTRQPEIYGSTTLADVEAAVRAQGEAAGVSVECFQSNYEGAIVERLHAARTDGTAFIIINPGAFTHTSVAIRDAFAAAEVPFAEVHISNVHKREPFRHHSYLSDIAVGVMAGFGTLGYNLAMTFALQGSRRRDARPGPEGGTQVLVQFQPDPMGRVRSDPIHPGALAVGHSGHRGGIPLWVTLESAQGRCQRVADRGEELADPGELTQHPVIPAMVGVVIRGQPVPRLGPQLPVGDRREQSRVETDEVVGAGLHHRAGPSQRELGGQAALVLGAPGLGEGPSRQIHELDPADITAGPVVLEQLVRLGLGESVTRGGPLGGCHAGHSDGMQRQQGSGRLVRHGLDPNRTRHVTQITLLVTN